MMVKRWVSSRADFGYSVTALRHTCCKLTLYETVVLFGGFETVVLYLHRGIISIITHH